MGFGAAEVRAKNSFMHRVLVVHAVTMLLLLGGMFGLSMTAAELSKETRVSNGGSDSFAANCAGVNLITRDALLLAEVEGGATGFELRVTTLVIGLEIV